MGNLMTVFNNSFLFLIWVHDYVDRKWKFKRALRLHFLADLTKIFCCCLTNKLRSIAGKL